MAVSNSGARQRDLSIGAFPVEHSAVGCCTSMRTKTSTASTDLQCFLNIVGQQRQIYNLFTHCKFFNEKKVKQNCKHFVCHGEQTCPAEDCSKMHTFLEHSSVEPGLASYPFDLSSFTSTLCILILSEQA